MTYRSWSIFPWKSTAPPGQIDSVDRCSWERTQDVYPGAQGLAGARSVAAERGAGALGLEAETGEETLALQGIDDGGVEEAVGHGANSGRGTLGQVFQADADRLGAGARGAGGDAQQRLIALVQHLGVLGRR